MHESQCHAESSFVTLTYREELCPVSLDYHDFQLFMKRLRRVVGKCRFYMCGEYGEKYSRPHFHACLFGIGFNDRYFWKLSSSGERLYRSRLLESLWTVGHCLIGDVSFESAAYVARYVMKKVSGQAKDWVNPKTGLRVYERCVDGEIVDVEPEFVGMSLKPGIGADWIRRFKSDVFPHDYVVCNGFKARPPRFYDSVLSFEDAFAVDAVREQRLLAMNPIDSTPERLAVRETVAKARLSFNKRSLV
jgi:hypothetical protein